jgi:hypothetical protein
MKVVNIFAFAGIRGSFKFAKIWPPQIEKDDRFIPTCTIDIKGIYISGQRERLKIECRLA